MTEALIWFRGKLTLAKVVYIPTMKPKEVPVRAEEREP